MAPLHLIVSDLGFTGHAKQVSLLAPALARAGFAVTVHSFNGDGPFAGPLREAGVPVQMGRSSRDWLALRGVGREAGAVVHVFGLPAFRRLAIASVGVSRPRVVVSFTGRERLRWFDRRFLKGVARAIVPHAAAAAALARQGFSGSVSVIAPAVGTPPPNPLPEAERGELLRANGLPADAFLLVTAGRLDAPKRLFDAIWAFEVVRYTDTRLRLVVVGDGPDRPAAAAAAQALAPDGSRVHFPGATAAVPAWLAAADIVVVTQRAGGANVVLEALAAGRPVVAANTPELTALVRDGETGILVPPADPPAAAKAINRLALDAGLRTRMGAAAARAAAEFTIERAVAAWTAVYAG